MLDRSDLLQKHRMLPNPKTVVAYRMDENAVVEKHEVPFSQARAMSRQELMSNFGPSIQKGKEINLFVAELEGFKPREYDRLFVDDEWWFIASLSLEMMDTRYRCLCQESSEVVE